MKLFTVTGNLSRQEIWRTERPPLGEWQVSLSGRGEVTVWQDRIPLPPDGYGDTLISGNPTAFDAQNNAQAPTLALHNVLIDNNVGTVISGTITTNGRPLRGSAGYVNAPAGDYHLTAVSNAVDQGNGLPPLIDLDGATWPKGVTTDIAAYEFTPAVLNNQTISFGPLVDKLLTDPSFSINATASSGLPVSFASLTPTICTVSGNTVTLLTTGTCRFKRPKRATPASNRRRPWPNPLP